MHRDSINQMEYEKHLSPVQTVINALISLLYTVNYKQEDQRKGKLTSLEQGLYLHLLSFSQMSFITEFSYSNNKSKNIHNYGKTIHLPFSQSHYDIFSVLSNYLLKVTHKSMNKISLCTKWPGRISTQYLIIHLQIFPALTQWKTINTNIR